MGILIRAFTDYGGRLILIWSVLLISSLQNFAKEYCAQNGGVLKCCASCSNMNSCEVVTEESHKLECGTNPYYIKDHNELDMIRGVQNDLTFLGYSDPNSFWDLDKSQLIDKIIEIKALPRDDLYRPDQINERRKKAMLRMSRLWLINQQAKLKGINHSDPVISGIAYLKNVEMACAEFRITSDDCSNITVDNTLKKVGRSITGLKNDIEAGLGLNQCLKKNLLGFKGDVGDKVVSNLLESMSYAPPEDMTKYYRYSVHGGDSIPGQCGGFTIDANMYVYENLIQVHDFMRLNNSTMARYLKPEDVKNKVHEQYIMDLEPEKVEYLYKSKVYSEFAKNTLAIILQEKVKNQFYFNGKDINQTDLMKLVSEELNKPGVLNEIIKKHPHSNRNQLIREIHNSIRRDLNKMLKDNSGAKFPIDRKAIKDDYCANYSQFIIENSFEEANAMAKLELYSSTPYGHIFEYEPLKSQNINCDNYMNKKAQEEIALEKSAINFDNGELASNVKIDFTPNSRKDSANDDLVNQAFTNHNNFINDYRSKINSKLKKCRDNLCLDKNIGLLSTLAPSASAKTALQNPETTGALCDGIENYDFEKQVDEDMTKTVMATGMAVSFFTGVPGAIAIGGASFKYYKDKAKESEAKKELLKLAAVVDKDSALFLEGLSDEEAKRVGELMSMAKWELVGLGLVKAVPLVKLFYKLGQAGGKVAAKVPILEKYVINTARRFGIMIADKSGRLKKKIAKFLADKGPNLRMKELKEFIDDLMDDMFKDQFRSFARRNEKALAKHNRGKYKHKYGKDYSFMTNNWNGVAESKPILALEKAFDGDIPREVLDKMEEVYKLQRSEGIIASEKLSQEYETLVDLINQNPSKKTNADITSLEQSLKRGLVTKRTLEEARIIMNMAEKDFDELIKLIRGKYSDDDLRQFFSYLSARPDFLKTYKALIDEGTEDALFGLQAISARFMDKLKGCK